ncbi:hypothetical protein Maq22A_c02430 [Methylobacterium aquaticum]|uniref:Uncharacterized protein n=1 Tax=Methylobacterium aquaticum TaxID=270351 RepID=A0A0C6EV97_9HYPH|nr:hypothetical protein Maq22A_c02430 [Methylobacterium aquaticum]
MVRRRATARPARKGSPWSFACEPRNSRASQSQALTITAVKKAVKITAITNATAHIAGVPAGGLGFGSSIPAVTQVRPAMQASCPIFQIAPEALDAPDDIRPPGT